MGTHSRWGLHVPYTWACLISSISYRGKSSLLGTAGSLKCEHENTSKGNLKMLIGKGKAFPSSQFLFFNSRLKLKRTAKTGVRVFAQGQSSVFAIISKYQKPHKLRWHHIILVYYSFWGKNQSGKVFFVGRNTGNYGQWCKIGVCKFEGDLLQMRL